MEDIKEVDTVLATHELVDLIQGIAIKSGENYSIETFSKLNSF